MVTQISNLMVFNHALQHLGVTGKLSDVNEDNDNGAALRTAFPIVLKSALEAHAWDFATTHATLSLVSDADNLTEFQYLFEKPPNCLRIWSVFTTNPTEPISYKSTKDGIYTNAETTNVEYTEDISDFNAFPGEFAEYLSYKLAEMAEPEILNSDSTNSRLAQKVSITQAKSASQSVVEYPNKYKFESNWLQNRTFF